MSNISAQSSEHQRFGYFTTSSGGICVVAITLSGQNIKGFSQCKNLIHVFTTCVTASETNIKMEQNKLSSVPCLDFINTNTILSMSGSFLCGPFFGGFCIYGNL